MNVYPSLAELVDGYTLPDSIYKELEWRYNNLSIKYLTSEVTQDGRLINRSVFANNADDAMEEIVDAIHAMLNLRMKGWDCDNILSLAQILYEELSVIRDQIE